MYTNRIAQTFIVISLLLMSFPCVAEIIVKDGKVTADLNSTPLRQVFQQLRQQTGVEMKVDDSVGSHSISASFRDLPVASAVKKMLEGTGVNYVVLGDEKGEPQSIFLGSSEKPGVAPRRLDNRPVNLPNRGVVTPVAPVPPAPPNVNRQQRQENSPLLMQQQQQRQQQQQQRQNDTGVNVPTGGGFVPPGGQPQPQSQQPQQPQPNGAMEESEIVEEDEADEE